MGMYSIGGCFCGGDYRIKVRKTTSYIMFSELSCLLALFLFGITEPEETAHYKTGNMVRIY